MTLRVRGAFLMSSLNLDELNHDAIMHRPTSIFNLAKVSLVVVVRICNNGVKHVSDI